MKRLFFSLLLFSASLASALSYEKPNFSIQQVHLTFELSDLQTKVTSQLDFIRESENKSAPLVLDGEGLTLLSISLDGAILSPSEYQLTDQTLTLSNLPDHFNLKIVNTINPIENTSLKGLYKTNQIFCTQNESEGFRNITYFLDRPDVMTLYTTKIIADQASCPILLSNGNIIDSGQLENGKHFVEWSDPYKKPSYLFALVAGDLGSIEDSFMRQSGRPVQLKIFCEKGLESKCFYAMKCLKNAMAWDESRFNLECDLDTYMIVAVDSFNAGAMENKGLNIFNSAYILADPQTSTDFNFTSIESVIGHEYFHNWTGNRVTLRDWYELNLKEALTVFRDQEFSLAMNSWSAQRIEDVCTLRRYQFPEDAGPTAHSIRPTKEINVANLYSSTIYCKGPEIIRMIQTLIGEETFNKGLSKYIELYDGQAVTTNDFVYAMELASHKDLSQFKRWYDQKGTPHLKIDSKYDSIDQQFTLLVEQSNPKEGPDAPALHIPLKIGLLDAQGQDLLGSTVLEVKKKKETFVFENVKSKPIVSLNRDFSAPVLIEAYRSPKELAFLMAHDSNEYARWEASRELSISLMLSLVDDYEKNRQLMIPQDYSKAFTLLLKNPTLDPALKALALTLPLESELAQEQKTINYEGNYFVKTWMKKQLAKENEDYFAALYREMETPGPYLINSQDKAKRQLKNLSLSYLTSLQSQKYIDLSIEQFHLANNMTDQFAALNCLNHINCPERKEALNQFYTTWQEDALVMNKWFSVEASSHIEGTLDQVKSLTSHPKFDYNVPNINRALLLSFARNPAHFHAKDGSGYIFITEQISIIDEINPFAAANLAVAFRDYAKLDSVRKQQMKKCLEQLRDKEGLSENTSEIINKTLNES